MRTERYVKNTILEIMGSGGKWTPKEDVEQK